MGNPLGDVNAQIQAFIVAYNSGKVRDIFASGEISILDDFPPYVWIGADALHRWGADSAKRAAAKKLADFKLTLGVINRLETQDNAAYVIVDAVYTYTENGTKVAEPGQVILGMIYGAGAWKINALTWSGAARRATA